MWKQCIEAARLVCERVFVIRHLDDAGYAFPLFVDNDFVVACPIARRFVFRAVEQQDVVSILLEISTFAQVLNGWAAVRVRVDSGSLIYVDRNVYSVPSRLIGEVIEARLTIDRVEVWYGQKKVAEMPRLRGRRKHRVDYRHIIDWLVRKPGAFENYRYREELFPTSRFRMVFDVLVEKHGSRGSKEYLRILELAARESESKVDDALRVLLNQAEEINALRIEEMLRVEDPTSLRDVEVAVVDLRLFDQLFFDGEVLQ